MTDESWNLKEEYPDVVWFNNYRNLFDEIIRDYYGGDLFDEA
jgi:hypothetical protein